MKTERLFESLGLPPGLSRSDFERPFSSAEPPRIYRIESRGTGILVGAILAWRQDHKAWITLHYGLMARFRGQELGSEAVRAVVQSLSREPGLSGIRALIDVSNLASLRVAEAAGLRPLGIEGTCVVYGWRPSSTGERLRDPRWQAFARDLALRSAVLAPAFPYMRRSICWMVGLLSTIG